MIDYKAVVEHKSKYGIEVEGVTLESIDPILEYTLVMKTDNTQLFNQVVKIVADAAWTDDESNQDDGQE